MENDSNKFLIIHLRVKKSYNNESLNMMTQNLFYGCSAVTVLNVIYFKEKK